MIAPAPQTLSIRARRNRWLWWGLRVMLLIALGFRLFHLIGHRWPDYQHDSPSHAGYALYVAQHHHLPPVGEDLEYPQQPLFYILSALFTNPHKTPDQNMENLAPVAFGIWTLTLCVLYLSLKFLSSWLLRYVFFSFFCFTPAFVLASAGVGNDTLVVFFGVLYFYSILRFNRDPSSTRKFALIFVALAGALLTKLTGVVLLAALPWIFWRRAYRDVSWKPTARRVALTVVTLGAWAAAILHRAWNPPSQSYVFVFSWVWDYMKVKENLFLYAIKFNLPALINAGQTTTTGNTPDTVRFDFPSWEYGNMLLGEYEYLSQPVLHGFARVEIIAGTFLLFGLALFVWMTLFNRGIWPWRKLFTLNRFALLLILGSTCMVLTFVYSVPNTCNADYRYQGVTFPWMGYCISRGLCAFPRSGFWQKWIIGFLVFFIAASLAFLTCLYIER